MNLAVFYKVLDRLDLCITLVLPFAMAFMAVLEQSPYAKWFIWGGWLFMLLFLLFTLVFHKKRIAENKQHQRRYVSLRFLVRVLLIILIPSMGSWDAIQDYIYAATAGSALALVLAILVAFIHKALDNTAATKHFGVGFLIFVILLIGIAVFPFAAETIRYYKFKGGYQISYLLITFLIEFASIYFIFYEFIKSRAKAIGPDVENHFIFIGAIFVWFFGLGITNVFATL